MEKERKTRNIESRLAGSSSQGAIPYRHRELSAIRNLSPSNIADKNSLNFTFDESLDQKRVKPLDNYEVKKKEKLFSTEQSPITNRYQSVLPPATSKSRELRN